MSKNTSCVQFGQNLTKLWPFESRKCGMYWLAAEKTKVLHYLQKVHNLLNICLSRTLAVGHIPPPQRLARLTSYQNLLLYRHQCHHSQLQHVLLWWRRTLLLNNCTVLRDAAEARICGPPVGIRGDPQPTA